MDTKELAAKYGLTEEWIEKSAAAYESGDFPHEEATVYSGSHLDAVGKKRVTVVYDASDTVWVATIARKRGVKPSEVYRDAMREYLDAHKSKLA